MREPLAARREPGGGGYGPEQAANYVICFLT